MPDVTIDEVEYRRLTDDRTYLTRRVHELTDEVDALEEVRMAVEQLVIPHREPVELLPRDERLRGMQAALITGEYRLTYETCGEGNSARIKILHTYIGS